MLNKRLLKQQGLTDWDEVKIENLHTMLKSLMEDMKYYYTPDKHIFELHECAKIVKSIEFLMQAAWKFDINENYHSYWYRVPHCTCPVLDNDELMGLDISYYTLDCPVHSGIPKKPEDVEPISKFYEIMYILDDKRLSVIRFFKWLNAEWERG